MFTSGVKDDCKEPANTLRRVHTRPKTSKFKPLWNHDDGISSKYEHHLTTHGVLQASAIVFLVTSVFHSYGELFIVTIKAFLKEIILLTLLQKLFIDI